MQLCIRVAILFGLLVAVFHTTAQAQINSLSYQCDPAYYIDEPLYDPGPLVGGCYLDPGPCWLGQTTFDVLLFDRSDATGRTIVNQVTPAAPNTIVGPLANSKDLGFQVTAGFRFNLVLPGDDGCDLVFNFLGAKFDSQLVNGTEPASYDFFEFGNVVPDAGVGTAFQTSYESTLTSVELNTRTRQWSRFAPMAGLRFIELQDNFDRLAADASSELQTSSTDNELWGFQVGGEGLLWDGGPVRLQTSVKAGVFFNDLDLSTGGGDITSGTTTIETTQKFSASQVAYFGEVNVELAYRIGRAFSIRAGYTAMWLDGVALAPDQHDDFNIASQFGTFDYGTVLYHGSYVGAEFVW